ncbi:MAG: hypothetical protein MRJ52_04635 [Nitrosomonas sp.]|nr:hypothetical protein [Nitrosomonas sp.]
MASPILRIPHPAVEPGNLPRITHARLPSRNRAFSFPAPPIPRIPHANFRAFMSHHNAGLRFETFARCHERRENKAKICEKAEFTQGK